MDNKSNQKYIDLCIEYALAYSSNELSDQFTKIVNLVSSRYPESKSKPIKINTYINEYTNSPTNIRDGLWFFFGNKNTTKWTSMNFDDYYAEIKSSMISCYVPFREFTEEDFQDSMKLQIYQDSLNIQAGRKIDIPSILKYSNFEKLKFRISNKKKPPL